MVSAAEKRQKKAQRKSIFDGEFACKLADTLMELSRLSKGLKQDIDNASKSIVKEDAVSSGGSSPSKRRRLVAN